MSLSIKQLRELLAMMDRSDKDVDAQSERVLGLLPAGELREVVGLQLAALTEARNGYTRTCRTLANLVETAEAAMKMNSRGGQS